MSKFESGNILVSNTEPPVTVMVTDGPQSMFTFSSVVLVGDGQDVDIEGYLGIRSKYRPNGGRLWLLLNIDIRTLATGYNVANKLELL